MSDPDKGQLLRAYLLREGFTGVPEGPGERAIRCAFHGDKHASASVNLGKGVYHCHTCDLGGDVYSLIQQREGLDFRAAYQWATEHLDAGSGQVSQLANREGSFLPGGSRDRRHGGRGIPSWRRDRP